MVASCKCRSCLNVGRERGYSTRVAPGICRSARVAAQLTASVPVKAINAFGCAPQGILSIAHCNHSTGR